MSAYWNGNGLPQGKLCLVEEHGDGLASLFFAETDDVRNVTGDDWNDVPYEANAGRPYDRDCTVRRVVVDLGPWMATPMARASDEGKSNSSLSADDVNAGEAFWLATGVRAWEPKDVPRVQVAAGETAERVVRAVEAAGGTVFKALAPIGRNANKGA